MQTLSKNIIDQLAIVHGYLCKELWTLVSFS